ncbi:MAG: CopG family antitoxin [Planctomycetota bacterium]
MRKKRVLPKFRSAREFAKFAESHDLSEHWDEFEPVEEGVGLAPALARRIERRARAKKLISIRLEQWQIRLAKAAASREGIPYHAVIRRWIDTYLSTRRARAQ